MEKSQPLRRNLLGEKTDPGGVAARPGKARDQTKRNGVSADAEDNRDRCGRRFGRLSSSGRAGRSDNDDATADEVSHERRQAIVSAVQPIVLDNHVLTLDVAGFAEASAERSGMASGGIGPPTADEADGRHLWLLRARRQRPCCRRTADHRAELASLYVEHGLPSRNPLCQLTAGLGCLGSARRS